MALIQAGLAKLAEVGLLDAVDVGRRMVPLVRAHPPDAYRDVARLQAFADTIL